MFFPSTPGNALWRNVLCSNLYSFVLLFEKDAQLGVNNQQSRVAATKVTGFFVLTKAEADNIDKSVVAVMPIFLHTFFCCSIVCRPTGNY